MKILVCISHVPDTTTRIKFSADSAKLDTSGIQWIINPWDELALTRALELKEKSGGTIESVDVLTVGLKAVEPTIRKALAIGADKGYRLDAEPFDSYCTAMQIAEVLKKEPHEVVLCGIDSSDYNGSNVGGMLAEILDLPSVSSVSSLDLENGQLVLKREIDGGFELLTASLPFVAIVQKGIAIEPRIPSMRGVMSARSKPLLVVAAASVEALTEFISYELPKAKAACRRIDPEQVKTLVQLLHSETNVI